MPIFFRYLVYVLVLSFSFSAYAQKYSNEFFSIGNYARGIALGNALTAEANDINSPLYNPAALSHINCDLQMAFGHNSWMGGVANYDFLGVAYPIKNSKRVIGINVLRFGIDNIPNTINLYDADGIVNYNRIKSFSAIDYAFIGTYSQKTKDNFSYGINLKILKRNAGSFAKSWGFGFDIGGIYELNNSTKLAVNIKDVTSTFNAWTYNLSESDKEVFALTGNEIPKDAIELTYPKLNAGISKKIGNDKWGVKLMSDAEFSIDGERNTIVKMHPISIDLKLGSEMYYKNLLYLRLGANNIQYATNDDNKRRLSLQPNVGVGFRLKAFKLDYAMANITNTYELGLSHVVSLTMDIDFKKFKKTLKNN